MASREMWVGMGEPSRSIVSSIGLAAVAASRDWKNVLTNPSQARLAA